MNMREKYFNLISEIVNFTIQNFLQSNPESNEVYICDLSKCVYNVYLTKLYGKNNYERILIGTFGHLLFEKYLKNYIPKSDYEIKIEHDVYFNYGNYFIKGKIDILIVDFENFVSIPIEVKFTRFEKPHIWYVNQLQLYMHALGSKFGYLLYINPNNLNYKLFEFEYDYNIVRDRLLKIEELVKAYKGIEPQREFLGCNACSFKKICFQSKLF